MKKVTFILVAGAMLLGCSKPIETLPEHYYPEEGDSIAVISPSALPDSAQLEATMNGLLEWGFVPVAGQHAVRTDRTLQDCYDDLLWALQDPSIRAIYCIRGGYAATEVMDMLPLDSIRRHPKPIIGYSDITVYHAAWTTLGLPSIHSSMSATFMDLPEDCAAMQKQVMMGQMPSYEFPAGKYHHDGMAEGRLIGGNLATLTATLNTAYDCTKTDEPFILLLEDVDDSFQSAHRSITLLQHMGVLDKMQGLILGDWTDFTPGTCYLGDSRGGAFESVYEMMFRQFFGEMQIPICSEQPFGHGAENYPLQMGEPIRLTVEQGKAKIESL